MKAFAATREGDERAIDVAVAACKRSGVAVRSRRSRRSRKVLSMSVAHDVSATDLSLADGAIVSVDPTQAEIRDRHGQLLVRYRDGVLELCAEGDVVLAAPNGEVVLRGKGVRLDADHIEARAERTRLVTGFASLLARNVSTTATRLAQRTESWELETERLSERARDVYREVSEVAQHRFGRLRSIIEDVYSVKARRTEIASDDDTSIDGKRVLLG